MKGNKMKSRIRIDRRKRRVVCALLQLYPEYKTWVNAERENIIHGTPRGSEKVDNSNISDSTADKVLRCEKIEIDWRYRVVSAIDAAQDRIGWDIENEKLKKRLKTAIWQSCIDGRKNTYESFYLPTIGRSAFYERRLLFISDVANALAL